MSGPGERNCGGSWSTRRGTLPGLDENSPRLGLPEPSPNRTIWLPAKWLTVQDLIFFKNDFKLLTTSSVLRCRRVLTTLTERNIGAWISQCRCAISYVRSIHSSSVKLRIDVFVSYVITPKGWFRRAGCQQCYVLVSIPSTFILCPDGNSPLTGIELTPIGTVGSGSGIPQDQGSLAKLSCPLSHTAGPIPILLCKSDEWYMFEICRIDNTNVYQIRGSSLPRSIIRYDYM